MISPPLYSTHGRQCRAWHDITAVGQHTRSDDVERGMTLPPLGSTHGRQHRAWHDITTFGQHTRSNNVGRGMPSSPLDTTHSQTTSSVAFHYHLWAAHTVKLRQAWHAIIAFGKHKKMNDVRRGMQTSPLGSTHGQTTSRVACQHRLWTAHGRKTSGVA